MTKVTAGQEQETAIKVVVSILERYAEACGTNQENYEQRLAKHAFNEDSTSELTHAIEFQEGKRLALEAAEVVRQSGLEAFEPFRESLVEQLIEGISSESRGKTLTLRALGVFLNSVVVRLVRNQIQEALQ